MSNEWINSCADKVYSTAFVRFAKYTVIAIKFNLTETKFWLKQTKNQRKCYYKTKVFEMKPIDSDTQITINNYSSAIEKKILYYRKKFLINNVFKIPLLERWMSTYLFMWP